MCTTTLARRPTTQMGMRLSRMRPGLLSARLAEWLGCPDRAQHPDPAAYKKALARWEEEVDRPARCTPRLRAIDPDAVAAVCLASMTLRVYQRPGAARMLAQHLERFRSECACPHPL